MVCTCTAAVRYSPASALQMCKKCYARACVLGNTCNKWVELKSVIKGHTTLAELKENLKIFDHGRTLEARGKQSPEGKLYKCSSIIYYYRNLFFQWRVH